MDEKTMQFIREQQKNEITEHNIYLRLAQVIKDKHNCSVLEKIAVDEMRHYNFWKEITKEEIRPSMMRVRLYVFFARMFGLSFSLRLMESGEKRAQRLYKHLVKDFRNVKQIIKEETEHEAELIGILNDRKLAYAGSIVLGLNDALVEFTGTLAGLTLAISNTHVIGITGLIMGLAASLSMAASGYLSSREDEEESGSKSGKSPLISAVYTGVAYVITVLILVSPYFIFHNVFEALGVMFAFAVMVIAGYTFYISVAKEVGFRRRFSEMAVISFSVALISFCFGWFVKRFLGVDG